MSFFDSLFMADATATGKNITSGHFQIIVNGFQPVFHIHWFFVKGVYLSNIKVGGDFGISGSIGVLALNCIAGGLIGGIVLIFKIISIVVEVIRIVSGNFWTKSPKEEI